MVDVEESRRLVKCAALFATSLWGEWQEVIQDDWLTIPRLVDDRLHLPPLSFTQINTARASAVHISAHRHFGRNMPFTSGSYKPRQIKLIETIEDARVEALMFQRFPELRSLLLAEIQSVSAEGGTWDRLIHELVLGLMQPEATSENAWVRKAVGLFYAQVEHWEEADWSVEFGLRLAHEIGQMRIPMNENSAGQGYLYRDDNLHLWAQEQLIASDEGDGGKVAQVESQSFLVEADSGRQLALRQQRQSGSTDALYVVEDKRPVLSYRLTSEVESEGKQSCSEWHYQLERYRENWCTADNRAVPYGDAEQIKQRLEERGFVLRQLQRIARNLRLERMQRQRRVKDGDELDLNLAVDAYVDVRRGEDVSDRIYEKSRPVHDGGLATQILVDISASTDRKINPQETILDVALQSSLMLTLVIKELYESVAIMGFCSNTRNQIALHSIKDFHENDIETIMRRMAGLESHWSTRLGAAIRHTVDRLSDRDDYHKLMLVVSDGEPSDIDVFDPRYLIEDARLAVQEARQKGVMVFCVLLNPAAERSARQIFGLQQLLQVSDVNRLPEQMAKLFLRIIRHY